MTKRSSKFTSRLFRSRRKKTRRDQRQRLRILERLEDRRVLTTMWQNPVDALDVNGDKFVTPSDVLKIINDLQRDSVRRLPEARDEIVAPFPDVNGDGYESPTDALHILNALNQGVRGDYRLQEQDSGTSERSVLIRLGSDSPFHWRAYAVGIEAQFDRADVEAGIEDRLEVHLVDPRDRNQALLEGEQGGPLFVLQGDSVAYAAPGVDFDGSTLRLDTTPLNHLDQGRLLFRLASGDGADGSSVKIQPLWNEVGSGLLVTELATLPGNDLQTTRLNAEWLEGDGGFQEFGLIVLDDEHGTVGGVAPDDPAYAEALRSSESRFPLFYHGDQPVMQREQDLVAGDHLGIYLVHRNPDIGSISDHLQIEALSDGSWVVHWEEFSSSWPGLPNLGGRAMDDAVIRLIATPQDDQPRLRPVDDQTVDEQSLLSVPLEVAGESTNPVFRRIDGPAGIDVDPSTGLLSWTPAEKDGPGEFPVIVGVTDDDGLDDQASFTIRVNEVNQPPQLDQINDQTIVAGNELSFTVTATDADLPENRLQYSITGDVPATATFDPDTGEFRWVTVASDAPATLNLTVTVDDQAGGTDAASFVITVIDGGPQPITLVEGERFLTESRVQITVPDEPSYFEFDLRHLAFDQDALRRISDAFEVALLDQAGNSLVHTIAPDRDAFFNISERGPQAAGVNTQVDGSIVRVDLAHLPSGTQGTVVYRLLNNDNVAGNDTATTVTVTPGEVLSGSLNTPRGASFTTTAVVDRDSVNLETLTDVTGSLDVEYFQTSLNDDATKLFAKLQLTNRANHPIDGPFVLVVNDLSDPNIVVAEPDGVTPDGNRYYLLEDTSGTGTIQPGESVLSQTLVFINPMVEPFAFDLTVLAEPNAAPEFVSEPNTEGLVDVPYRYEADATDADDDTLVYALLSGPSEAAIDSQAGILSWSPTTDDVGTHAVLLEVTDGRGGRDTQQFSIEVKESIPNRPPVIISTPVVETYLGGDREAVGNLIVNADFEAGPTGFRSDYAFSGDNIIGAAEYSVTTDPAFVHPSATSYGDNTTGSGSMLAVNGSTTPGDVVWEQTVSVGPNLTYDFAAAISTWFPGQTANLSFVVNGEVLGELIAPQTTGVWTELFATWDSGDATTATIQITNSNLAFGGNDFALDDIYFGDPIFSSPSYEYPVVAIDPDIDPIEYQLDAAPTGMRIDPTTGIITWAPRRHQIGTHAVQVTATDGRGGTATQEYEVAVFADPSNNPPVIVTDPIDELFIPGFSNPSSGDVSPQRISLDLGNGQTFDGTVSITLPDTVGRFADIVIAVDESGSMGGDQDWIAEMIPLLDQALVDQGIGDTAENPNRFAIVGFGGGRDGIVVGHFLNQEQPTQYTLYGPDNEVVATGSLNEVVPDELLNERLPADGRYVLVIEAANADDLPGGIDLGVIGETADSVRIEPLQFNTIVEDAISTPGQPIEYQFVLTTRSLLYFDSLAKDGRLEWTLIGPAGTAFNEIRFDQSDVSLSSPVADLVPGDYRLIVDAPTDVLADIKFQMLDLAAATVVTSGQTVVGEVALKNETFAYRFRADEEEVVDLVTSTNGVHPGSLWRLIDADGNVLASNSIGQNLPKFVLPRSGEFYLLMEAAQTPKEGVSQLRIPSTFEFTVNIEPAAPPTAISVGQTVNGQIEFVADFADYSFNLPERSLVYVDSFTDSLISWTLNGPGGQEVNSRRFDFTDSFNQPAPVLDLVAGDYQLRVNSNGVTGPFAFRVVDLGSADSITPGTEFSDELTIPSETDFVQFTASAGDEFFVDVVAASDANNTLIRVIDPFGQVTLEQRSLADAGPFKVSSDGVYTLLVEGWKANTDVDTYTINVVPVAEREVSLTLGTLVEESLATPGDRVAFTFDLANDALLYFDSLTNNASYRWTLEGPRGTEVSDRSFTRSDSVDVSVPALDLPAGTYRLTVHAIGDTVGDFSFRLLDLLNPAHFTPITPNPGSANPSVTINGAGVAPNETEVFRFTVESGDVFNFVTTVSGSPNSWYRVLDVYGNEVTADTALQTDRLDQEFVLGGTYYLTVEGRISDTTADPYSIDINWVQNNGPTMMSGTPLVLDATTSGDLSIDDQVDSYTFSLGDPSLLTMDVLTNNSTVRWSLMGPRGVEVNNRSFVSTDSLNSSNPVLHLPAGDYQLDLFASSGTPGAYAFRMVDLESAAPMTLGTAVDGELDPPNETDFYRFDLAAGDRIFVDVETASDINNTEYKLVDRFGQVAATSNRLRDFGPLTVSASGTFTLLVEGWRGNADLDTYTINVYELPSAPGLPLALNTITDGSITVPGETVEYTFSLTDRSQLLFDSLTNNALNWTLEGPSGTIVSALDFDDSDESRINGPVLDLPAGDYSLVVDADGDTTDSFSFQLLDLAAATSITPGVPVTDQLPITNSTALYSFDATAGDIVYFDSQSYSGFSTPPYWRLIDPVGNQQFLGRSDFDQGPLTLQLDGSYTLTVEGRVLDTGTDGEFAFDVVPIGNELNPPPPTALTLGDVVNSEIGVLYETDRYSFTLDEPSLLYFDSLTNDASLTWSLEVNQRQIVDSRRFDFSDSSGFNNPVLNLQPGEYTLSVTSSQAEPYSFRLFDLDDATTVATDTQFSGVFDPPNATNAYRFSATAGQPLYFDVIDTSNASSAVYRLVDPFGQVLLQQNSLTDRDVYNAPNTSDFYLLVEGKVSQTASETYEMNLVSPTFFLEPLVLGETQSGSIAGLGDTTEYLFSLAEDATLYFDSLTNSSLVWSLEGPGGIVVNQRAFNASDSFNFETPLIPVVAGDYSLTVDGRLDELGDFSFRLLDIDQQATPVILGTPFSDELTIPNETDIYQFTAAKGDEILVDVLAADDTNNTLYRIFDPWGNEVYENRDLVDGQPGPLGLSGAYTLLVEGWRANTDLDTYSLNLQPIDTRDGGSLTLGTPISDSIAQPGERVEFTFALTDHTLLHFDSLTNSRDITWTLTGPRGIEREGVRFDRSDSIRTSTPGIEYPPGLYTLTVDATTDVVGDFSFNLIDLASAGQSIPTPTAGNPSTTGNQLQGNPRETHAYRFDAVAGDQFSFDATVTGQISSDYRLVDPFGRDLFRQFLTADRAAVEVPHTGTYYLVVEGRITNADPDEYTIEVTYEGNTLPPALTGEPLALGDTQAGDLSTADQVDSYQFTLSDRSLLYMDALTNNSSVRWSLSGPRGQEVNNRSFPSSDSTGSNDPVLELIAGDYQLDIFASHGTPGEFAFRLVNLDSATPIVPGTAFGGELDPGNETELYAFDAVAGDRFLFDVETTSDVSGAEFKLINRFGQVVFESNRLNDEDVVTMPNNGTYTLLVEGLISNGGPDTYTMNVVPFVETTSPLQVGDTVSASIDTPGEELVFEFVTAEPSLLFFSPISTSNDTSWTLSGSEFTYVDMLSFGQGFEFVDLPTGSYSITVDGEDDFVGDVAFFTSLVSQNNVLGTDGSVTTGILDSDNAIQLYQFVGSAGEHFALRPELSMQFADAARSAETALDYATAADPEDGYSGIDVALRADVFRPGAAVNYIVVTDEDRDNLEDNVTFETLFTGLSDQSALLNVVVSGRFGDADNNRAIGVDSLGTAYLADGSGGFTVSTGGQVTSADVSTQGDYIDLAWALNGAAWDLSLLRAGGVSAESFTNAFVDVKVAEILEQTSLTLVASNSDADFQITDPAGGAFADVVPGQSYDFDIQIGNDGRPLSFDLLFQQGQTVGSIPVYIVSPYEYGASAVDPDGDLLTWSITAGPDGLAIDSVTGVLAWPIDSVVFGEHPVTIRVEDSRGGFDEQSFVLDVNGGQPGSISGVKFEDENQDGQFQTLVDVIVPGNSNPYLAGMPDGSTASGSDIAPDQSPVLVEGLVLEPGSVLTFTAEGAVSFSPSLNPNETPDGKLSGGGFHGSGAEHGLSNIGANWNSLLGVFLGPDQPNLRPAPETLNFLPGGNVPGGINFTSLAPKLQQIFFVGDGVTDDAVVQEFTVPEGATRLFLGTMDGTGWFNNSGFFSVTVGDRQEPTLPDFTIYLDQNRNGIRDDNEIFTTTGPDGSYQFDNLAPGTYVVAEEPQPGWQQTAPDTGVHEVALASGKVISNVNFGNTQIPVVNTDPVITSDPPQMTVAGEDYRYQPTVEELDGDTLSFDLPLAPDGMAINADNGTIRWKPTADDVGTFNVLLRVRDGNGGFDLQYFGLQVNPPNTAPVITSTPPTGPAGVRLPFTYDVNAVDAEEDILTYSLDEAPEGATIDADNGVINWTPATNQVGTATFSILVEDGRGLADVQSFDLPVEVNPPNIRPVFLSQPPLEARLGDNYIYFVEVIDNNGDALAISLETAPDGMVLESDTRISWIPGPTQLGDNLVRIQADDGRGEVTIQEFTIRVASRPVNLPPAITSRPPTAALVDEIYRTDLDAVDPNSDSIIWQLLEAPRGMSIDPFSGELNWTPSDADIGNHTVSVEALDSLFASSQLTYNLRVRAVNSPPVLQSSPPTEAAVGSTYLYQVAAEDVDQDTLTFTLPTAPAGMTINPVSGRVQWTPETGQEGGHEVEITVSDSLGATVSQRYAIQVASGQPNQPPTIVSNPALSASVGDTYTYDVDADDPDGDTLTYSLLTRPDGMTIDPQSGLIQWTPTSGDLGVEAIEVLASDPAGAGSLQGYPLAILASNNAPTITSTPPTTLAAGEAFRYDVLATDADGEFLTYELADGPEGMILDGLGRMFWAPTADQIGEHDVSVRVSDPRDGVATQSFTLTVETDTQAPQVAIQLSDNPVDVGSTIDIRVTAIDNVGVENLLLTVGGTAVPLDENGVARLTMDQVGSFAAVATATDAAGNSADQTLAIFVADPNDVEGPVLAISSPADGGTITAITDIIGTVNDDTLVSYRILLGDFATRNFREIASGTENVNDGVLGQIDPTVLVNDTYILRLEAIDAGGNQTALEQMVNLDGALKLGEFQLGFVDMTIPLANLPINITRTYDSLRSERQGDFGFGWRLDYRDADLRTSLPSSGLEDAGIYTPFRDGTKVYITLPGGERQGFTFTPSIQSLPGFGANLVLATPRFTPDPGVTSRLTVRGGRLIVNQFGELQAGGGVPWNPASPDFGGGYTLTTADGLKYFVDGNTGLLRSATHPNGEQLTFSDAAVTSSLGTEVQFLRDAQGRIVSIVDPEGNAIEYGYDTAGDLVSVVDREKNETRMVYSMDRAHYLEEVIDPLGRSGLRTEYDVAGRLSALIDAQGNRIEIATDLATSTQIVKEPLGNETLLAFDARGNVVQETNALGQTITREFDSNDFVTKETDPLGNVTSWTYDQFGNELTMTDALGNTSSTSYTNLGDVAAETDPLGNTTTYEYTSRGSMTKSVLPTGETMTFTYNASGRLTSANGMLEVQSATHAGNGLLATQVASDGTEFAFTYDANGNTLTDTRMVDGVAATTVYTYDAEDRVASTTDALNQTETREYDAAGNLIAMVDPLGRRTEFIYDERDLLVETILPDDTPLTKDDNPRTKTQYDALGRAIAEIDALGRRTEFEYDALGRLITTIFPDETPDDRSDNPRIRSEYDAAGREIATIDELGHRTEIEYDAIGNVVLVRNALGQETAFTYNAAGQRITQNDSLGNTQRFVSDASGRLVETIFPDGTAARSTFDDNGRPLEQIDGLGNVTSFEYDSLGRLLSVVDAIGGTTTYTYGEYGQPLTQTDANGHTTTYQYDLLGRRTGTELPMGQTSTTTYDAVGNVTSTTDFNGDTISYTYDVENRLILEAFPEGHSVLYSYDAVGNLVSVTDPRGTITYEYDARDRLLAQVNPDGTSLSYEYDAVGNRTALTIPSGTVSYTYDALNRLSTVTDSDSNTTSYTYDAAGRLVVTSLPNGVDEVHQYDQVGRVISIEHRTSTATLESFVYTYDAAGRRTSVAENDGRIVNYAYDAAGRLVEEEILDAVRGNRTITYTYDAAGNRLTRNDSVEGATTYVYDDNDRLISESLNGDVTTYTYDDNGNTLTKSVNGTVVTTYEWNSKNQLVSVDTDADGTADIEYEYDPFGIQVSRTENGEETRFLVDRNLPYAQVVEEYTPGGVIKASYVFGHRRISQVRDGDVSFYLHDILGSTRALTDTAGSITDRYLYDAFGRLLASSGTTVNPFLYTGERRDAATGLDYLRARHLNTSTGRFVSRDAFPPDLRIPVTLNRYAYANANPMSFVDPSGEFFTIAGTLFDYAQRLTLAGKSFIRLKKAYDRAIDIHDVAKIAGLATYMIGIYNAAAYAPPLKVGPVGLGGGAKLGFARIFKLLGDGRPDEIAVFDFRTETNEWITRISIIFNSDTGASAVGVINLSNFSKSKIGGGAGFSLVEERVRRVFNAALVGRLFGGSARTPGSNLSRVSGVFRLDLTALNTFRLEWNLIEIPFAPAGSAFTD